MEPPDQDAREQQLLDKLAERQRKVQEEAQREIQEKMERVAKWADWMRSTASAIVAAGIVIASAAIYIHGIQSDVAAQARENVALHEQINTLAKDTSVYFKEQAKLIEDLRLEMKDKANRP